MLNNQLGKPFFLLGKYLILLFYPGFPSRSVTFYHNTLYYQPNVTIVNYFIAFVFVSLPIEYKGHEGSNPVYVHFLQQHQRITVPSIEQVLKKYLLNNTYE